MSLLDAGYNYASSEKWIFRHLQFDVLEGEAIRIIGRNGSGKSTLLKVISGILKLTEGKREGDPRFNAAYMDQFSGEMLARDLTVAEQLKAAQPGVGLTPILDSVQALTDFGLGLQHRMNEFIGHLSGGQRQIIALLCTLNAGARILCLDEFTSAMDEQAADTATKLLTHVRSSGQVSLVIVDHRGTTVDITRDFALGLHATPSGGSHQT